ncbi:MAG: hypothetical protein QOF79_956, partial [Actinomycetota bacterium]|nr:hypothetical protein [Actinomycetota bacterium]
MAKYISFTAKRANQAEEIVMIRPTEEQTQKLHR